MNLQPRFPSAEVLPQRTLRSGQQLSSAASAAQSVLRPQHVKAASVAPFSVSQLRCPKRGPRPPRGGVAEDAKNLPLQQNIRLHRVSSSPENHVSNSDDWCFVSDPTEVTYEFEHDPSVAQFAANVLRDDEMPLQSVPSPNEAEEQELQQLSPQQRKMLSQEIDRAHKGMGHPNHDRFLRILKLGGASLATMALAKMYSCSQCRENTRPKPWRRAAPPRELQFNEVVGIDTFTVKHFDHSIKCLNVICCGTRYQMVIPLQGERASDARAAYRQWVKLFGPPKVIKPDLGTEFLKDFLYRCSTDGTEVDPSSLESPTQNSITEREGGSFKTMFNKASLDYGRTDDLGEILELLETVVMYKNRLTHRGGYSAIHRVFGYTPSMPGDVLMSREQEDNLQHHDMISLGDVTLQRQQRMRECAGKAFFASECATAIRRAGRLIKAAPEQCRRVSEDEDASCSEVLKRLCNVRDSIRETKISGVSDIRGEPFPDFEHPTGRKRNYGKQPPVVRSKIPRLEPPTESAAPEEMSDGYPSPTIYEDSDEETMAMESDHELLLEIETDEKPINAWYTAMGQSTDEISKKASKEIKLKDLNPHDAHLFKTAIDKEWNTNIANGAIKVLDPVESQRIRQQMPNRVMQSRLLHVAKPLDDPSQLEPSQILNCSPSGIPCKAKSRWIARGDKDPDIFSVCASSPVIHRDTFMLGLQVLASKRWRMHFADFSQAFMQGDGLQREQPLFCEPPVKDLPGVQPGCLIQICKTVYGLVDAPYRWNQHLDKLFKSMGYQPSILDACCYMLHAPDNTLEGIIMVATDDLISGGNSRHQALMEGLKQQYKFGKWEYDAGEEASFSMIGWKSHTLKRRTVSTLSAETQGIVESAAVACWYRYLLAEFFYRSLIRQEGIDWETMIEPLEFGLITDAKSVYDALTCPTGSGSTDKRTTIDLAIIREYLRRHNGCIRWIDGSVQLADSLTKFMTADFLRSVMQRGSYQLRAEYETLELKQQARIEKKQRKGNTPVQSQEVKPTESIGDVNLNVSRGLIHTRLLCIVTMTMSISSLLCCLFLREKWCKNLVLMTLGSIGIGWAAASITVLAVSQVLDPVNYVGKTCTACLLAAFVLTFLLVHAWNSLMNSKVDDLVGIVAVMDASLLAVVSLPFLFLLLAFCAPSSAMQIQQGGEPSPEDVEV
eukprot:s170_g12.t1